MSQLTKDSPVPDKDAGRRSSASVVIDKQICKACGLCVAFCPRKVLKFGDQVNAQGYRAAVYKGTGCIGCRTCQQVCPEPGAIDVRRTGSAQADSPEDERKKR